ncbi:MAG: hypothetical protein ACYC4R_17530 [Anaerolineae bacterium]
MRCATGVTVRAFGILAGLAGIEHGVGEILQGNRPPVGMVFSSWPDAAFFRGVSGEPAMSLIPNLLISGILSILVSLALMVWAGTCGRRRHGGLILALLSLVLLLVGGGFGPPLLGLILAGAGSRIAAPPSWWRADGAARMARWWPWTFAAALATWLAMFPGTAILGYLSGMDTSYLLAVLLVMAFGLLLLAIVAGFAYDTRQLAVRPAQAIARRGRTS